MFGWWHPSIKRGWQWLPGALNFFRRQQQSPGAQNSEVGQLSPRLAHDLNNALAVVISSLNLLQLQLARGDTDVQEFIDTARRGAEGAAGMTRAPSKIPQSKPFPASGKRILLVEDETMIALELAAILEAAGFEVKTPATSMLPGT